MTNYKIQDIEKSFDGKIIENLGNNDYVIKINDAEHKLKIITMNSNGIEFILNQQYHKAKYLEQSTNEMNIVIDNVPIVINLHTHFDKIVYKWSGNLHDYGLMAKTRRDYGENPTSNKPYTIDFNITSLLEI